MFQRTHLLMTAVALVMTLTASYAQQPSVAAVYPGAAKNDGATELLKQMGLEGTAYTSSDPLTKVVAFYKGQKDLNATSVDDTGALFEGKDVNVTIQNPWMDGKTGQLTKSTLISIVKTK